MLTSFRRTYQPHKNRPHGQSQDPNATNDDCHRWTSIPSRGVATISLSSRRPLHLSRTDRTTISVDNRDSCCSSLVFGQTGYSEKDCSRSDLDGGKGQQSNP